MKIFHKAILPRGFKAAGVAAGLKKSGKIDLALFYSALPAKAKGMFTTNTILAAPVMLCKKHLAQAKRFQAIIVNSGNANCFTAKPGFVDAYQSARAVAKNLAISPRSVLVSSTGIIGKRLAVSKIKQAIPGLVTRLSAQGIDDAKRAIMTTDKFPKEITVRFMVGSVPVTMCGVAKGAGMIAPTMATMLAYIFTDANIASGVLGKALHSAVEGSFNCITVDGCMSTNDTVIIMANGAAGNKTIDFRTGYAAFTQALQTVCLELAKLMVKDGEGATKFIEIRVSRAKTAAQARKVALAIANSNLFKTAIYGENPNFGRIVQSAGSSGIPVKEKDLKIKLSDLKKKEVTVEVSLGQGVKDATVYTSDLTPEYIKINAAYN